MKFGKNLERVVRFSDPEWTPYWVNYKMLKKLINDLRKTSYPPTILVRQQQQQQQQQQRQQTEQQSKGGETTESPYAARISISAPSDEDSHSSGTNEFNVSLQKEILGSSPGEIAFFRLLHSEFAKASHFFQKVLEQYEIREMRVKDGKKIMMRDDNATMMISDKWARMARGIYRLYKELLLVETYAIMTYCSFSKILKKHDKVTGHDTKNAFMKAIVNKANFTSCDRIREMIRDCERLYNEVSELLETDGRHGLYEDERLFIGMISQLNNEAGMIGIASDGVTLKQGPIEVPSSAIQPIHKEEDEAKESELRMLLQDTKRGSKTTASKSARTRKRDESGDRKLPALPVKKRRKS